MKFATFFFTSLLATVSTAAPGSPGKDWTKDIKDKWDSSGFNHASVSSAHTWLATWSPSDWASYSSYFTHAKLHNVVVGGPGKLSYDPPYLSGVKKHDIIVFSFLEKNHTVTESSFDQPCTNAQKFDTGFVPNLDGMANPTPIRAAIMGDSGSHYFYCKQKVGNHCGKGMVFAVNLPEGKTFEQFKQNAIWQNGGNPDVPPV